MFGWKAAASESERAVAMRDDEMRKIRARQAQDTSWCGQDPESGQRTGWHQKQQLHLVAGRGGSFQPCVKKASSQGRGSFCGLREDRPVCGQSAKPLCS